MRMILAFLAAILAPACILAAWFLYEQLKTFDAADPFIWISMSGFLTICLMISAIYVVVLGVPAYALLRWRNAVRWWSTLATGFILGATPVAITSCPVRYVDGKSPSIVDGVQIMVDGELPAVVWIQYLETVSFLGVLGAIGAFAFWLVARKRLGVPTAAFE